MKTTIDNTIADLSVMSVNTSSEQKPKLGNLQFVS